MRFSRKKTCGLLTGLHVYSPVIMVKGFENENDHRSPNRNDTKKETALYVAFDWGQNMGKIILQPANLSMAQIYLGKVPDTEAMRWIENLYA